MKKTNKPTGDDAVIPETVPCPVPSPSNTLNTADLKKIGKGALIAFGGAFGFSILTALSAWISQGNVTMALFRSFLASSMPAALSVGINALIKWWQGPKE